MGEAWSRLWVKRGASLCARDTAIIFLRPFTLGDRKVLATCPWSPQVQGDLSLLPPALERMTREDWIIEPVISPVGRREISGKGGTES